MRPQGHPTLRFLAVLDAKHLTVNHCFFILHSFFLMNPLLNALKFAFHQGIFFPSRELVSATLNNTFLIKD